MFDEDSPDEPDEFDPVDRWGAPEKDLPNVPTPPAPEVTEEEVDPELLGLWWRSVALANVALGGVAIGLMVIGFRGMWVAGLASVVLGVVAGLRLYQHYRAFQRREGGDTTGGDATDEDAIASHAPSEDDAGREPEPDAGGDPDDWRNA